MKLTLERSDERNKGRRTTFNGVNLVEKAALESDYSRVCCRACTLFVAVSAFSYCTCACMCARSRVSRMCICRSEKIAAGWLGASIESGRFDTAIVASVTVTIDRRFSLLLFYPTSWLIVGTSFAFPMEPLAVCTVEKLLRLAFLFHGQFFFVSRRILRNAFKVREEYLFVSRWIFDFVVLQKKKKNNVGFLSLCRCS